MRGRCNRRTAVRVAGFLIVAAAAVAPGVSVAAEGQGKALAKGHEHAQPNGVANGHSQPEPAAQAAPHARPHPPAASSEPKQRSTTTKARQAPSRSSGRGSTRRSTRGTEGGTGGGRRRSSGVTTRSGPVPNSGCTVHHDTRDSGSCQEKGRGNSGDIDPYRGPDNPANTPARGNDCDEGGGNNRTSYPRATNPNNAGDSDVDSDRGRGNNRCGQTSTGGGGSGGGAGGGGGGEEQPRSQQLETPPVAMTILTSAPSLRPLERQGTVAGERTGGSHGSHAGSGDPDGGPIRQLARGELPFTGLNLLWALLLAGVLLGGGGSLRRFAGATS